MVGKKLFALVLSMMLLAFVMGPVAAQTSNSGGVTIEFAQWWEPELPAGSLRAIMDDFQAQNPGITVKLISGPYSTTHDQIVAGAATGTLSDGRPRRRRANDLAKQGAIEPLDGLMASTNFDASQVAAIIKLGGKSYMFPVASFVYPVFINLDMFKAAGIANPPRNRNRILLQDAKKLTKPSINQYGWVLPLSLQNPNGAQNDVMSWVWASARACSRMADPTLPILLSWARSSISTRCTSRGS